MIWSEAVLWPDEDAAVAFEATLWTEGISWSEALLWPDAEARRRPRSLNPFARWSRAR